MMNGATERWRTLEHTADLAIEVEAADPERLFTVAALAMTGVLMGREGGEATGPGRGVEAWRDFALEATDREALLVDWLRELLYVQVVEGLILAAVDIEELGETRIIARAGFAAPSEATAVERELKGVTYHDLAVGRRGGAWFARVVFDL